MNILDEHGDLDENKCLQLVMTPHLAFMIQIGTGPNPQASSPKKVFILVKPNASFYTELNEAYLIHIIE